MLQRGMMEKSPSPEQLSFQESATGSLLIPEADGVGKLILVTRLRREIRG